MTTSNTNNREGWLTEVARQIEPYFRQLKISPYRLTCGWPCKKAISKNRRVGECHSSRVSAGGIHEIFISPVLEKPLEVAGTVCHEMAHVVAGIEAGHGKGFIKVCKYVGLVGKPTQALPGKVLGDAIAKIVDKVGIYPHQAITVAAKTVIRAPSQTKLVCPCGCSVVMGLKWLEEAGVPTCGCGMQFTLPPDKDDESDGGE